MSETIRRELLIDQPREAVWQAIAARDTLAEWMFPNDFEPRVGHRFTFRVPAKPQVKFEGLTVDCEVLECDPPSVLIFSWSAGGAVVNTKVSFRLHAQDDSTRLVFEHSDFELSHAFGAQAFKGAEYGWVKMLGDLQSLLISKAAL